MKPFNLFLVIVLAVGAIGGGGSWWYLRQQGPALPPFRTVPVKHGDLLATIGATGTIEPEEVVDVGAQVAGLIDYFGKDPANADKLVDNGTSVAQDTVLAHIDETVYQTDVDMAQSQKDQAIANVDRAKADLGQMQAKLTQAQRDWERAQKVGPSDALSQNDYDLYQANFEIAKANIGVGEAVVKQAQQAIVQGDAQLRKAQRNLSFCTIKSPVKGVIISRRVNIGQTVVSSLSAPSMFLIAKDLTRMQVWASVNEADIGQIKSDLAVTFTVDAFPSKVFTGKVQKVRLDANQTQNVVTYTVEVITDNSSGVLLPYMTANVQFEVEEHKDVLMVANAALRWIPTQAQIAPEARSGAVSADGSRGSGVSRGNGDPTSRPSAEERKTRGMLWVEDGTFVKPVKVRVGLTDGSNTEVFGEGLSEGMKIVVGETSPGTAGATGEKNPFAPQFGGRGGGGGRGGRGG